MKEVMEYIKGLGILFAGWIILLALVLFLPIGVHIPGYADIPEKINDKINSLLN